MSDIKIPQHVAIIMDGNRRWAQNNGLADIKGHEAAIKRVEELTQVAAESGVQYLTLWAWSNKNWSRNPMFINDMLNLFRKSLESGGIFQKALNQGVDMRIIGSLSRFPRDLVEKIQHYTAQRPSVSRLVVNIALGYDGRDELIQAVKQMIKDAVVPDVVTPALLSQYLYTSGQPDVDFLIRTGGEKRTSGFLLWQIAESEYYFTDTYFPDFDTQAFKESLAEYAQRERRFGGDSLS